MILKYTHQEMDKEVSFPAGYYAPRKEVRLKHDNREVLYIVGNAVVEASCCGTANWTYALVPGYIVNWHGEKNENNLFVTGVEPINDEAARDEIKKIIRETEGVAAIEFWSGS